MHTILTIIGAFWLLILLFGVLECMTSPRKEVLAFGAALQTSLALLLVAIGQGWV